MLHRRRLRDPEPAGPGLLGPSPWWDLSPALAMRLHLLASLSGGGLAWRAGDRRWLAGEGQIWWALGAVWPGGRRCLAPGMWSSWQVCPGPGVSAGLPGAGRGCGRVLGAGRAQGISVLILAHSPRPGPLGSGLPLASRPAGSGWG